MRKTFESNASFTIGADDDDQSAAIEAALDAIMAQAAAAGAGEESMALARATAGVLAPWLLAQKKAERHGGPVVDDVVDSVVSVVATVAANYACDAQVALLAITIISRCHQRLQQKFAKDLRFVEATDLAPAGLETLQ